MPLHQSSLIAEAHLNPDLLPALLKGFKRCKEVIIAVNAGQPEVLTSLKHANLIA